MSREVKASITCDGCGKTVEVEHHYDTPVGWWSLERELEEKNEKGHSDYEEYEFCSDYCLQHKASSL